MNNYTVVGYTLDGEFYCADCFEGDKEGDAVFASEEWDEYPTCSSCGEACEDVALIDTDDRGHGEYEADDEELEN